MAKTWVMILVLACYYYAPALSAAVSQKNLAQFANMLMHKGYNPLEYNGYGCSCGAGSHGPLALDATDKCCRIHDDCYGRIQGGWFGCYPKLTTYAWQVQGSTGIVCTDVIDTCDRNACECDKAAADCFEEHRSTYKAGYRSIPSSEMAEICNV